MADEEGGDDVGWLEEELQTLSVRSAKIDAEGKPSVLCSVLTDRFYKKEGFKAFVRSVWKTEGKFTIQDSGQNLFLIQFEKEEDLNLVFEGGPWVFKRKWILMARILGKVEAKDVRLNKAEVWLRLLDVPPDSDKEHVIQTVGDLVWRGFEARDQ